MTSSTNSQATEYVPYTAVRFEDTFWAPRLQTIREQTLPFIYKQMQHDGHFSASDDNWQPGKPPIPYLFWESDISKWIEAASYSLAIQPDETLSTLVEQAISFLLGCQQPDGYLNLWFTRVEPDKRWSNLRDYHELYCAGHLIEAAVAHFQATGKRELLDAVCRYADYIAQVFGAGEGQKRGYCGHEEIELALLKLYHATDNRRYLDLSDYFIEERGREPHYFDSEARARGEDPADFWAQSYEYNQAHLPVREQQTVVGHAVRAMYLGSAVVDLGHELQDSGLQQTGERLWQQLTTRQLYITGGLGPSAGNEGFTSEYDLPNATAYAETCASIGLVMYSQRLLLLDAHRRYADVIEQALYNGVLSSISQDGKAFFYVNPLESAGEHHRQPWFICACCPPNLARLILSLGQYVYSVNSSNIFVHLYAQSSSTLKVGATPVILHQKTNYPWDGTIQLTMELEQLTTFGLHLRIPSWCHEAHLTAAGEEISLDIDQTGYAHLVRNWQSGDEVVLCLEMPIERIYAHPAIEADTDCIALQRGPLVYCLEGIDNNVPLQQIHLPTDTQLTSIFDPTLLNGVVVIQGIAHIPNTEDWSDTLYRHTPPSSREHQLRAIPYYAWDQRGSGQMRVWIKV